MKAIITRYKAPTEKRGSRIIASDEDGNKVIFDHSQANSHDEAHANAAKALCKKMGWKGTLVQGSLKPTEEVFIFIRTENGTSNTWIVE